MNKVTPGLFKKYPTVAAMAAASQDELAQDIRSTGFFNNKARSLIGAAKKLMADYKGEVPRTMEELLEGSRRGAQNIKRSFGRGV